MSIRLSIVIVTWNSEGEVIPCLDSIIKEGLEDVEVIVVDNDSKDRTRELLEKFKDVKVILNDSNLGYTKACNQGMKEAQGEYVLLLNPDTIIYDDALKVLLDYVKKNGLPAAAPQLLNEDMTIQHSCRTLPRYWDMFCEMSLLAFFFPRSKVFARWKMRYFDHNSISEVEQPMAAALLVRRDILDEIGYMDERYKMFFNDVDLCKKLKDGVHKIIFYPESKIIHSKGRSIFKVRKSMIKEWNRDCMKYFKKHHYNFILYPLLAFGIHTTGFIRTLFTKSNS